MNYNEKYYATIIDQEKVKEFKDSWSKVVVDYDMIESLCKVAKIEWSYNDGYRCPTSKELNDFIEIWAFKSFFYFQIYTVGGLIINYRYKKLFIKLVVK